MTRPLMSYRIGQLEEMFAEGKADSELLKQLENELKYRKVPRAITLLADVQAAIHSGAVTPQSIGMSAPPLPHIPAPLPQQSGLWERPAIPPVIGPSPTTPVRSVNTAAQHPTPSPATQSSSTPEMPLDEAYKVLKASPGATWDSIEQTRRTLVLQAHPSRWKTMSAEKRSELLGEAKRINAAYAVLSNVRCGRR